MKLKLPPIAAFNPRLLSDLKGYNGARLLRDLGAGATVGVVALPLAMAFAIASGLKPEAGLWTAIIGGFLISALGGSSVQIGGPAGAFIVIVAGIIAQYGLPNLLIATACAGVLIFLLGLFKLGNLVRLVPVSVILGFTNGIAILIALSQVRDWLGLVVPKMPADFFHQIATLWQHRDSFNPYAFGLGLACVLGLYVWPKLFASDSRFRKKLEKVDTVSALKATSYIPAPVVALVSLSVLAWALNLPVETIGSRFGELQADWPQWVWPEFSWQTVKQLLTPTLTIALLGALESLLCARVADQLSPTPKHDPNQELMAQGIANMTMPFFGGMPATGTIARTVTNIRAGGSSPVAGMVHAIVLAVLVLVAGPMASAVPLSVLAGILLFVAWNMGEWAHFAVLQRYSLHYRLVFLSTFLLTVIFDLTVAMEVGVGLACVLFVKRMSALFVIKEVAHTSQSAEFRIVGSLFFGTAPKMDALLDLAKQADQGFSLTLDLSQLYLLDTTGLEVLEQLHRALRQNAGLLHLRLVQAQPYSLLERTDFLRQIGVCVSTQIATNEEL